jgi:polysaccharide pyruvyl transferase WcaK-like protein
MKSSHPRITLLGNNSGRNLGDMAIMSSIMESLSKRMPDSEFYVPTIKPEWVRKHYGDRYNVKAVNVMPWTLSLRLLGLPTLICLAKSDVALICDGIIFGKKLFNPAFNYLITLVVLAPLAKLLGCKMVCYSTGIGPFQNKISRLFAKWTINNCDLVMMRERDSEKLTKDIGVTQPVELTGDAAFINPVSDDKVAVSIMREIGLDPEKPAMAINATAYLDTWLNPHERLQDPKGLLKTIAEGVKRAQEKATDKFQPMILCTHPMDEATCRELAAMCDGKVLTNSTYLSHDIQAVIRRCGILVGMRFHSIVLASSVETPVVGLIYAPKVRGYLRLLECEDYSLELASLTPTLLGDKLTEAWNARKELQERQRPIIGDLKEGAEHAADLLCSRYFGNSRQRSSAQLAKAS